MRSIRVKSMQRMVLNQDPVIRPRSGSSPRNRFNWRLWVVLGTLTELFLIYVARWWAPSPITYFLAVLFLPVMVLTGFWSFKYFRIVQENLELSRRADQNLQELTHFFETATAVSNLTKLGEDLETLTSKLAQWPDVVVTMGCGDSCPVISGKRYLEWDLADPADKSLAEVRQIREDIQTRVMRLAESL